jgi:hypothetical protein
LSQGIFGLSLLNAIRSILLKCESELAVSFKINADVLLFVVLKAANLNTLISNRMGL